MLGEGLSYTLKQGRRKNAVVILLNCMVRVCIRREIALICVMMNTTYRTFSQKRYLRHDQHRCHYYHRRRRLSQSLEYDCLS